MTNMHPGDIVKVVGPTGQEPAVRFVVKLVQQQLSFFDESPADSLILLEPIQDRDPHEYCRTSYETWTAP